MVTRVLTCYMLLGPEINERVKTIEKVFEGIKQKYDLKGYVVQISPIIMYMELIQEPQILRSALEDLFSEAKIPHVVYRHRESFDGYDGKEEEQGYMIAQEVLDSFGYSLKHGVVVRKRKVKFF